MHSWLKRSREEGGGSLEMNKVSGKKIAIPSDPKIRLQALSVMQDVLANIQYQKPEDSWRVRLLRASTITPKFRFHVAAPCGTATIQ
jgi:hypothetical protein